MHQKGQKQEIKFKDLQKITPFSQKKAHKFRR